MTTDIFKDRTVLITGGTGSFGQRCIELLLKNHKPKKIIVYSRDELKQSIMMEKFADPKIRYFIGDVRDKDRLYRAFKGVDFVIHAAALKQVPAIEYNPFEAIRTNVIGAYNVISAAIDCGVEKVIALSTDKAASPINLYGATKLCSDKLFISGNSLASGSKTKLSVIRYGNVVGSRGSVVPLFLKQKATGKLTITDERMTRFFISLDQGINLAFGVFEKMCGGEIYVPKIPSVKMTDVARAVAPDAEIVVTGIRAGEKLHEVMIPEDESRNTIEFDKHYVIQPQYPWWGRKLFEANNSQNSKPCSEGFRYASDTNTQWLTVDEIRQMIDDNLFLMH